jgi:hypothetical protein
MSMACLCRRSGVGQPMGCVLAARESKFMRAVYVCGCHCGVRPGLVLVVSVGFAVASTVVTLLDNSGGLRCGIKLTHVR